MPEVESILENIDFGGWSGSNLEYSVLAKADLTGTLFVNFLPVAEIPHVPSFFKAMHNLRQSFEDRYGRSK